MKTPTQRIFKASISIAASIAIAFASGSILAPSTVQAADANIVQLASTSSQTADSIIKMGKRFLGTPYLFGAKFGDTDSFDCSSFTKYLFDKQGIDLPRESIDQSKVGKPVKKSDLQPGDLVFFYSPIHHVGIYIGDGQFIHTYGEPGVMISDLNNGWWSDNFTSARRVIE